MTYFEFHDKPGAIPKVVVVEGNDALLAQRAFELLVERVAGPGLEALNVDRFDARNLTSFEAIGGAMATMPFMGSARLIVVRGAHELRADPRRELARVVREAPVGNVLAIEDLRAGRGRGEAFGDPGETLRIDATSDVRTRTRFVRETLAECEAEATPAAVSLLTKGNADLLALRTDIQKLALLERRIEPADVERESMLDEDLRASQVAAALVEGRVGEALLAADDFFEENGRGAAFPLLAAAATDYAIVWDLARPGGELPARARWRERALKPVARRLGEAGARRSFERAIVALESLVTGRFNDGRLLVELLIVAGSLERSAS